MKTKDLLNEEFDYEGTEMSPLADKVAQTILARAVAFHQANPDMQDEVQPGDILMEQFEVFTEMVMQRIERMS